MKKPTWDIPYLPEGKEFFVVPENDPFMIEAIKVRNTESTDLKHSTGAVIVKDGIILGKGANKSGFKNPKLIKLHSEGLCVRKFFNVKSGKGYWMCPGCSTSKNHAEGTAIKDVLKRLGKEKGKKEMIGADLYLYGHYWCCKQCWDNMIKAGINRVFLVEEADRLFGR